VPLVYIYSIIETLNHSVRKFFFINPGDKAAIIFLFITVLLIRLPFFFQDYIDWDESTFILMGQGVADGYLPYEHIWDLKPPLLFYFFGLIEYVFPHSLVALRLAGTLIIFLSALLLLKITGRAGLRNKFIIALFFVLFCSTLAKLKGVMSEPLSVLFLLAGIYVILKSKSLAYCALSGFLFGCAAMVKINLAICIPVFVLLFLFLNRNSYPVSALFRKVLLYVTGFLFAIMLTALPYILKAKTGLFIDSVFHASLEYGRALHLTVGQKLNKTYIEIIIGLVVSVLAIRLSEKAQKEITWISVFMMLAIIYTFYSSGNVNDHYRIQIAPFLFMLAGGVILKREFKPRLAMAGLFVFMFNYQSWYEFYRLWGFYRDNGTVYHGRAFDAIRELKSRELQDKKIYFANLHIGYWLLNKYPLTNSTTHPSNIVRPYLFRYMGSESPDIYSEIRYLMETIKPEVVVIGEPAGEVFAKNSREDTYFTGYLSAQYRLTYRNRERGIYIWETKEDFPEPVQSLAEESPND